MYHDPRRDDYDHEAEQRAIELSEMRAEQYADDPVTTYTCRSDMLVREVHEPSIAEMLSRDGWTVTAVTEGRK